MNKSKDLAVFVTSRDATCGECGEDLGRRAWITLTEDKGTLCLSCADLDHLVYLPAGKAALTRRAQALHAGRRGAAGAAPASAMSDQQVDQDASPRTVRTTSGSDRVGSKIRVPSDSTKRGSRRHTRNNGHQPG